MTRLRFNPLLLMSLGLTALMVSILLVGIWVWGIFPEASQLRFDSRKVLIENLAAQYSKLAEQHDVETIQAAITLLVTRNADILSAALVKQDGKAIAVAGPHQDEWNTSSNSETQVNHMEVPIYNQDVPWGSLQVSFERDYPGIFSSLTQDPLYRFLLYVTVVSFPGFFFFMRRALRHLDPSTVIPKRVKTVLDTLEEGVVLLDDSGAIVLTNIAFLAMVDKSMDELLGRSLESLPWKIPESPDDKTFAFPWLVVRKTREHCTDTPVILRQFDESTRELIANCTSIVDDNGAPRGILVSFNDVTELSRANEQLFNALEELHVSQAEIQHQNEQLQWLATRDPLTGALNRRALFEQFEEAVAEANKQQHPIGCLMMDLDNFKIINDVHGHTAGDRVLEMVADSLRHLARSTDFFGRYGGEEFCMILPGLAEDEAANVAERIRSYIEAQGPKILRGESTHRVTASLGVSSLKPCTSNHMMVIDEADQALYMAKTTGKNRVIRYSEKNDKSQLRKPTRAHQP